jgi:hypothetical protein
MNTCPCSVCGEGGHHPRACPSLRAPLTEGFYSPPAGHRPSGEEDDEKATRKIERPVFPILGKPQVCQTQRKL